MPRTDAHNAAGESASGGRGPHVHPHGHHHGPASPHPAQPAGWSIFRMTMASRFGAALAVSAGLWAIVLLAMRPA